LYDVSKETHIRVSYQIAFSDKAMSVPERPARGKSFDSGRRTTGKRGVRHGAAQEESDRRHTHAEIADAQSERMDCASAISDE
jgi:hypothetical protein